VAALAFAAIASCGGDDSTTAGGPGAGGASMGGAAGAATGGAGGRFGGDGGFVPCAGKRCGDICSICPPNDPNCVGIEHYCDLNLECQTVPTTCGP
jgi:hypothetical protein